MFFRFHSKTDIVIKIAALIISDRICVFAHFIEVFSIRYPLSARWLIAVIELSSLGSFRLQRRNKWHEMKL